jgi:hypothetical protein
MNEGINLLDPNKENTPGVVNRRVLGLRAIAMGMLFLVSASSIILFILVTLSPLPELKKQETSLRATLATSHTDMAKLSLVNERAASIQTLLASRKSFDQTLELIQSKLPSGVDISAIQIDANIVSVTVESKSLKQLDDFINGLVGLVAEKNGFSRVTMTSLINDDSQSKYSVSLNLLLL